MNSISNYPIFVFLSSKCNYRCSYCFTSSRPSCDENTFLSKEWEKVVDDFTEAGVTEIRLSGGEPLILAKIESHCDKIKSNGLKYTITSNGSLLKDNIRWIKCNPPETLWLSYHTEYISPNGFLKLVKLASGELKSVGVNIFAKDLIKYEDLVTQCASAGANRIKILHTTPLGRQKKYMFPIRLTSKMVNKITWELEKIGGVEFRIEAPVAPVGMINSSQKCVLTKRPLISVNHDGNIFPCCITIGHKSVLLGDLKTENLFNVFRKMSLSTTKGLPCIKLLPSINNGKSLCPLMLVNLS